MGKSKHPKIPSVTIYNMKIIRKYQQQRDVCISNKPSDRPLRQTLNYVFKERVL